MDKYAVYHNIKSVQSIVAQYPAAASVSQELINLANQLASRVYRVAVVGEFKRGKSSLLNCILGTEILPTDILPSTAVVNRVVYGDEQKIEICYKNGKIETTSVKKLEEYATKKNEMKASQIREIVVHYPAVFCQNNIQLLDTPGLNDNEFMDKTTLDVLDKIDTAIVVTHACYPVSETEQKLICRLIEQDDIYHLTFVATFIDKVSDEPEEQDRVVALIRSRLSGIYTQFCKKHPDDSKLQKKAKRILCEPVVFAVSSRLAMQGFIKGNKKMLDESRFPHFKYELSALLTANQELDLQMKAARLSHVAKEKFASWHANLLNKLDTDLGQAKGQLQAVQAYQKSGCEGLMDQLVQVDRELENSGIFLRDNTVFENSDYIRRSAWTVMRNLLQIDPKMARELYIQTALKDASRELERIADRHTEQLVHRYMQKANEHLIAAEKKCGLSGKGLTDRLADWMRSTPFPRMDNEVYDLVKMIDAHEAAEMIRKGDVVVLAKWVNGIICSRTYACYCTMQDQLRAYIASWRSQLLKQNLADKNEMGGIAEQAAQRLRNIRQQKEAAVVNYSTNQGALAQAEKELSNI